MLNKDEMFQPLFPSKAQMINSNDDNCLRYYNLCKKFYIQAAQSSFQHFSRFRFK